MSINSTLNPAVQLDLVPCSIPSSYAEGNEARNDHAGLLKITNLPSGTLMEILSSSLPDLPPTRLVGERVENDAQDSTRLRSSLEMDYSKCHPLAEKVVHHDAEINPKLGEPDALVYEVDKKISNMIHALPTADNLAISAESESSCSDGSDGSDDSDDSDDDDDGDYDGHDDDCNDSESARCSKKRQLPPSFQIARQDMATTQNKKWKRCSRVATEAQGEYDNSNSHSTWAITGLLEFNPTLPSSLGSIRIEFVGCQQLRKVPGKRARAVALNKENNKASGTRKKYTLKEDRLLIEMKEKQGLSWDTIKAQFPDRSVGSLQVHYSTKLTGK